MENQINNGIQNSQQIGQNPVNQLVKIIKKPKAIYWIILTFILVIVIIGSLSWFYIGNITNRTNQSATTGIEYKQVSSRIPTPSSRPPTPTPTISFFAMMEKGCDYNNDSIIANLTQNGMCTLIKIPCKSQGVPPAYRITYKSNWRFMEMGGPGRMTLCLSESEKLSTCIHARWVDRSLDKLSDSLTEIGNLDSRDPIVDKTDSVISKAFLIIGKKKVLTVEVKHNKELAKYYMFEDPTNSTLYTIAFDDDNKSDSYLEFIHNMEEVISSMEFIPDKVNENC